MNKLIETMVEKVGGFYNDEDGNPLTPMLMGEREIKEYTELVIAQCAIAVSEATTGGYLADKFYQHCMAMNKHFKIKP